MASKETTSAKIRLWSSWIDEIREQHSNLLNLKQIYDDVQDIISKNKKLHQPSSFYDWLSETYVTTITVGLRRVVYKSGSSICLLNLIQNMAKQPEIISREYYVGLYKDTPLKVANKHYDKLVGDEATHPSKAYFNKDITDLNSVTKTLKDYVDKHVAHIAPNKQSTVLPTWKDLNDALLKVEAYIKKYCSLIKAEGWVQLTPTIQEPWKAIFETAWIDR